MIGCKAISDWMRESAQSTTGDKCGKRFDNFCPYSDLHLSIPLIFSFLGNIFGNFPFFWMFKYNSLLEIAPVVLDFIAQGWRWGEIRGSVSERPLELSGGIRKREREREGEVGMFFPRRWTVAASQHPSSSILGYGRDQSCVSNPPISSAQHPFSWIILCASSPSGLAHPLIHGASGRSTFSHRTGD